MNVLYVYISASCPGGDRARQLIDEVQALRPIYPVRLVDLDQPDAIRPAFVFGTPTYTLGERIISLGNPALQGLLDILDREADGHTGCRSVNNY